MLISRIYSASHCRQTLVFLLQLPLLQQVHHILPHHLLQTLLLAHLFPYQFFAFLVQLPQDRLHPMRLKVGLNFLQNFLEGFDFGLLGEVELGYSIIHVFEDSRVVLNIGKQVLRVCGPSCTGGFRRFVPDCSSTGRPRRRRRIRIKAKSYQVYSPSRIS